MSAMHQMLLASSGFRVGISPTSTNDSGSGATIISSLVTATPIGGSGSYTYLWQVINDTGTLATQINSSTSAASTFKITGASSGDFGNCDVRCRVTDTVSGQIVTSPLCHVHMVST